MAVHKNAINIMTTTAWPHSVPRSRQISFFDPEKVLVRFAKCWTIVNSHLSLLGCRGYSNTFRL